MKKKENIKKYSPSNNTKIIGKVLNQKKERTCCIYAGEEWWDSFDISVSLNRIIIGLIEHKSQDQR